MKRRHRFGALELGGEGRARFGDHSAKLYPQEYKLLAALLRADGRVVARPALARAIGAPSNSRTTLDSVVSRLRKKLHLHDVLVLVPFEGYRLAVVPEGPNTPIVGDSRGAIPTHLGAFGFFGSHACLIDPDVMGAWTPLDGEVAREERENLVPLANEHRVTWLRDGTLDGVGLEDLRVLAKRTFELGQFRRSYALGRLACETLARRHGHAAERIEVACYVLTALRSSPVVSFLVDTLRRAVLPALASVPAVRVPPATRLQLALELAAIARDYEHAEEAIAILELPGVARALEATRRDPLHPSRALHCLASAHIIKNDAAADRPLRESLELAESVGFPFGVSNVMVSQVEQALRRDRPGEGRRLVEETFDRIGGDRAILASRPPIALGGASWQSVITLLVLAAELERWGGDGAMARRYASKAADLALLTDASLRPSIYERLASVTGAALAVGMEDRVRRGFAHRSLRPLIREALDWLGDRRGAGRRS